MSRKGNCWANAVAESFFSSLKKERIKKQIYKTRALAQTDVAAYIDTFYNQTRRHSYLGGLSPEQFEAAHQGDPGAARRARVRRVPRATVDSEKLRGYAQAASRLGQTTIPGPQALAGQCYRREQMDIDPAQTAPHQLVGLDERKNFFVLHRRRLREVQQEPQDLAPAIQPAAGKFADNERMAEHGLFQEQPGELSIGDPQVVDPDGGVDQDHAVFRLTCARRLGMGRTAFSEPPNAARRLALSRATSA